jgi:septal ring factor EnvC (AmiA/AmiB activator)
MCRYAYIPAVILAIGSVTGCTVTDDPSQGGLVGGVYGLSSGAYDKRVAERQARLDAVRGERQTSEQQQQVLQSYEAKTRAQKAQLANQVTTLSNDTQQLSRNVASLQTQNAQTAKKKAELERRLAEVNAQIAQLQRSGGAPSAADYEKKQRLEKEIEDLWQIYNSL